ncbi:MAG: hypothetical protein ABW110_12645 [Steroidobacteraceae bacterium]
MPRTFTLTAQILFWVAALSYVVFFAFVANPAPLQDLPNHVARAAAISDLLFDDGKVFGQFYSFHPMICPYILSDLIGAVLVGLLGPHGATVTLATIAALGIPFATLFLARSVGCAQATSYVAATIAFFFSLDWTFSAGYIAFRFGIAMALVTIACFLRVLEHASAKRYAAFGLALVATYLIHLSGFVIVTGVFAAFALADLFSARRIRMAAFLPGLMIFILGVYHVIAAGDAAVGEVIRRSLSGKVEIAPLYLARVNSPSESIFVKLGVLFCAIGATAVLRWRDPIARSLVIFTVTLGFIFLALPQNQLPDIGDVDVRALPYIYLATSLATVYVLSTAKSRVVQWSTAVVAFAFAMANIVILGPSMHRQAEYLAAYSKTLDYLPPGTTVLPIDGTPREGLINPYLHGGSIATYRRGVLTPYVFAGNGRFHMDYFRVHGLPGAPPGQWYKRRQFEQNWPAIGAAYQYAVVTKPTDLSHIGLCLQLVGDGPVSAVYRIRGASPNCAQ